MVWRDPSTGTCTTKNDPHTHSLGELTEEPHTHWHRHEPLVHRHPHYPDLHHRHEH